MKLCIEYPSLNEQAQKENLNLVISLKLNPIEIDGVECYQMNISKEAANDISDIMRSYGLKVEMTS